MPIKHCLKCRQTISRSNKTGYCNHCRDRNGVNNSFYGKSHSAEYIEKKRLVTSAISKALWQNAEYRAKVIAAISKPRPESFRLEQSKRIKEWYAKNPRQRELRKSHMTRSWAEGKIVKNNYSCNRSKAEEVFFADIKGISSDATHETLRVGNNWYFPDVIIPFRKTIIEYYGDYWHANPDSYKPDDIVNGRIAKEIWDNDAVRIKELEEQGYCVYTVWDSEYRKHKTGFLSHFDALINWESCIQ